MRIFSLAFLAGILFLQNFPTLPCKSWFGLLCLIPVVILFCKSKKLRITIIGFCCGFFWCLGYVYWQLSWTLPNDFEGKTVEATGFVASIPNSSDHFTSFLFAVKKLQFENRSYNHAGLVRLTWRQKFSDKPIKVGAMWRLPIRLKKFHSTANPGSFDFEAKALEEGVRASGYVVTKLDNQCLQDHFYHYPLQRFRECLKNKLEKNLPVSSTSPWLIALVIGERHNIYSEKWDVLRKTGTNHLMAIAGLHIGCMAGLFYWLANRLWRLRSTNLLLFPAQQVGMIAALVIAIIYSALAGFSLPTQRACIMLSVFLLMGLSQRKSLSWQAWSLALVSVLLLNPLSVLSESFWLSFAAVAFIIYGMKGRLDSKNLWWKWGRLQWVLTVGLIPLSLWLFQQYSFTSFLANFIAIPIVEFLIVPACLLGTFLLFIFPSAGVFLLFVADKILGFLWNILAWLSNLHFAVWYQYVPNHYCLLAAIIGTIILLVPQGFPGRWFGLIGFLPILTFCPPLPKSGEVWLTLLDVGQGLSTVIQTQRHTLVFDAGPKLGINYDMGESVVLPFLRVNYLKKIDMLVVSHSDNDHIGGVSALLKQIPVNEVRTSVPEKIYTLNENSNQKINYCLQGQSWIWDKVEFKFLYPTNDNLGMNNDSSCVLRISTPEHHILLTGDIEKYAEKFLVKVSPSDLSADVLIAPHHGSKTSAVNEFIKKVNPHYVLYPIGYRNRYHFPHESVREKYQELGTIQLDTAQSGAIFVKFTGPMISYNQYRQLYQHYWTERHL